MVSFPFRSQRTALTGAFFIAPLGAAIWGALSSLIFAPHDVLGPLGFAVLFYFISLPVGITLGIPSLYLIARFGSLAWWSVGFSGVIAGVLISLLLHLPLLLYAPIGFVWASVFYLIWLSGPTPTDAEAVMLARLKERDR